jgi:HTH-type transcriptional regulator/antitoxin HigA
MDEERYGELLKQIRPRIIDSPEEHERLLVAAEGLMDKGEALSAEEREVLALIVLLIEAFEAHVMDDDGTEEEEDGPPPPHVALQRLLQGHELNLDDVVPIFGNPHAAQEAIEGKRPITRGQAKELGKYFRVPPKLFRAE